MLKETIAALQQAQSGSGTESFDQLLLERLDATLDEHINAARDARPAPTSQTPEHDDRSPPT